jgi:phosphohistidine phosphatase
MRLMLLRHAKAEKSSPTGRDRDRPLNPRGQDDALLIGAYMTRHGLLPDRVLISSAARTSETWDLLSKALALSATLVPPDAPAATATVTADARAVDRLYNAVGATIVEIIRTAGEQAGTLLVVGHNPGLHETAQALIAAGPVEARERLNEGLPTTGLAVIDIPGDDWRALHPQGGRLERFITPRLLKAATD